MLKEKMLLGATKEGTLVFANVSIRGEERIFSVSFDEVQPFIASDEYLKEYLANTLDCYSDADKWALVNDYDCKPSELLDEHYNSTMMYYGVEGIMDISLYPKSYSISDIDYDIYFESVSCGQGDHREQLIPINDKFTKWLFNGWDGFHLQHITEHMEMYCNEIIKDYVESFDEDEWIKNWLEEIKWEI